MNLRMCELHLGRCCRAERLWKNLSRVVSAWQVKLLIGRVARDSQSVSSVLNNFVMFFRFFYGNDFMFLIHLRFVKMLYRLFETAIYNYAMIMLLWCIKWLWNCCMVYVRLLCDMKNCDMYALVLWCRYIQFEPDWVLLCECTVNMTWCWYEFIRLGMV